MPASYSALAAAYIPSLGTLEPDGARLRGKAHMQSMYAERCFVGGNGPRSAAPWYEREKKKEARNKQTQKARWLEAVVRSNKHWHRDVQHSVGVCEAVLSLAFLAFVVEI